MHWGSGFSMFFFVSVLFSVFLWFFNLFFGLVSVFWVFFCRCVLSRRSTMVGRVDRLAANLTLMMIGNKLLSGADSAQGALVQTHSRCLGWSGCTNVQPIQCKGRFWYLLFISICGIIWPPRQKMISETSKPCMNVLYKLYTSFGRTLIASDWFVFLILLRGEKSLFEIRVLHANSIWLHEVWRLIPTSKSIFPCIQACKLQRSSNTQLYMKWQCCWVSCSPASGFSKGSLFCLVFHSVCFIMIFRFLIGCLALCWRWSISYAYSILLFVLHLTGL